MTTLYVNSPGPGSTYQRWHRDGGADFYDHKQLLEEPTLGPFDSAIIEDGRSAPRVRAVGMKFGLCDTTVENGAIEICPGSHKMPDYATELSRPKHDYNRLLLDGSFHDVVEQDFGLRPQQPMQQVLKKGDCWIQDPRI